MHNRQCGIFYTTFKVGIAWHQINAEYASGIRRGSRATNRVNWVLVTPQDPFKDGDGTQLNIVLSAASTMFC